jgi:Double zinc ribbon
MSLNACPYCDHGNPAESKFCNACGGALHLVPCPRCGAVSDVTATSCYQCKAILRGSRTDAPDTALPTGEVPGPLPRWRPRAIAGTAVLAVVAVLGYYGFRQRPLVEAPQPPAASSEASDRGGSAGAGAIRRDVAASDATPAKADDSAGSANSATAPPETPLAGPTPAATDQPRPAREPVVSREMKAATPSNARAKAVNEGRARDRVVSRLESCTEAAAALGLCTVQPVEKKEAETAAGIDTAIARPRAADAGKAGQQEPLRQDACTEAVAALGLCAPTPTQRRE